MLVRNAAPNEYDALVVVGGAGSPLHLWPDVALQKLARDMHEAGKVVAAICLSSVVLARAGVLKDKEATVFETKDSVRELEQANAKYVNQDVVDSGTVVTANGPDAAGAFAQRIMKVLGS
jgi:protease I